MTASTEEYRKIRVLKSNKLTPDIVDQLDNLFEVARPEQYRDTLIELYHMYILHEHHSLPINFHNMANQLCILLDFLKMAEEELPHRKQSDSKD